MPSCLAQLEAAEPESLSPDALALRGDCHSHSEWSDSGSPADDPAPAAVESPHSDILGHCTGRLVTEKGREPSSLDAAAVFSACTRTGTAVAINSRPERRDPPEELLRLGVDLDCRVSIDTDAHAPGQLEWLGFGCEQAAQAGVPSDSIGNSWQTDRLLEWTAGHETSSAPRRRSAT